MCKLVRIFALMFLAGTLALFLASPVWAGASHHNNNAKANAEALAKAWASGGTSSAVGGGGKSDILSLGIPGAVAPSPHNTQTCIVSTTWAIPLYSESNSRFGLFCMVTNHRDDVCKTATFLAKEARNSRDIHVRNMLMARFTDARQNCIDLHVRTANMKDEDLLSSVVYAKTVASGGDNETE